MTAPPAPNTAADSVVVLDFGSQTARLIARRVRECHVYSELLPHDTPWEEIQRRNPKGIILSGSPASVYDDDAPRCDPTQRLEGRQMPGRLLLHVRIIIAQLGAPTIRAGWIAQPERRGKARRPVRSASLGPLRVRTSIRATRGAPARPVPFCAAITTGGDRAGVRPGPVFRPWLRQRRDVGGP